MKKQKYLYVLLTKTPLKTGKLIRKITKYEYNHVSITFDKNLNTLYSFTRKYKTTTFYAGLVKESSLRYTTDKKETKVKVFKIPLKEETYKNLKTHLNKLTKEKDKYLYNLFSAIAAAFHKKINIKNAYTCCEFVIDILETYLNIEGLNKYKYCSIKDLSKKLEKYLIFEGTFKTQNTSWGEDTYIKKKNLLIKYYKVLTTNTRLTYRLLKGLILKLTSY